MSDPHIYKFDLRVRHRLIDKGVISSTEVQEHLANLPDVGDKADTMELSQPALADSRAGIGAAPARVPAPAPAVLEAVAPAEPDAPETEESAPTDAPAPDQVADEDD